MGGNNGWPGGPPRFPFRCQEEPCRCRLGPSGLGPVLHCSFLRTPRRRRRCAAPRARILPGESALAPAEGRAGGAGTAGDGARTRGSPGAGRFWNLRRPGASEAPPGSGRPTGSDVAPLGSPGDHVTPDSWGGGAGAGDPPPHSRRRDPPGAGSLRLIPDSLCSLSLGEHLVWLPLRHAPPPVSLPLMADTNRQCRRPESSSPGGSVRQGPGCW